MLGRVAYGQTQYAHSGSTPKWKIFQELIIFAEVKTHATSKTFKSFIKLLDEFNIAAVLSRLFKEYVLIADFSLSLFIKKVWTEMLSVLDGIGTYTHKLLKEFLSAKDFLQKTLSRFVVFVDNIIIQGKYNIKMYRMLIENISVLQSLSTHTFKILQELISVRDTFLGNLGLLLKEFLSVRERVVKNINKIFTETLLSVENFATFISGQIFFEYLLVKEGVIKKTSKIFQSAIIVFDKIRNQLNGFIIRWDKKARQTTTWVKQESPETIWEKKQRRSIED
jgi:hypothetical protein